jgi:triacylglycerol lipase
MKKILLVHGLFNASYVFRRLQDALNAAGYETFAPDLLPCGGEQTISEMAHALHHAVETQWGKSATFDIVAFSMGGLISRFYLQELGGAARVNTFVTLGSPHHGSLLAWFRFRKGIKDMRQGSPLLRKLAASESRLEKLRVVSIRTPFDMMVIPSTSSIWRRAENISVPVLFHCNLLTSPKVHHLVHDFLGGTDTMPNVSRSEFVLLETSTNLHGG